MDQDKSFNTQTHPRVLTFAGSKRNDSVNRKLAKAAAKHLENAGVSTTFVELRDYPMPLYDGDLEAEEGVPAEVTAFQELMQAHDALLIASPEFNGSFSALLKNLIDWVSLPIAGAGPTALFRGKIAGLLSASPGHRGGQRGLKHLRELLEMIGVTVVSSQLSVGDATHAFDLSGELIRTQDLQDLQKVLNELQSALASKLSVTA